MHTFLKFNLVQDLGVSQRFSRLVNELPQTGHTFSVGLTITVSLHLRHLTEWSLTRLISSGSRLVTGFFHTPLDEVIMKYVFDSLSTMSKNISEAHAHPMTY